MPEPLRADYTGHQCRCVIVVPDGLSDPLLTSVPNRCGCWIDNPDQPICDGCEQRHAGMRGLIHFEMAPT